MTVVEYYIKGDSDRHARYFPSRLAARNFYALLKNDPLCVGVRIVD
jgi:hypothetical protein